MVHVASRSSLWLEGLHHICCWEAPQASRGCSFHLIPSHVGLLVSWKLPAPWQWTGPSEQPWECGTRTSPGLSRPLPTGEPVVVFPPFKAVSLSIPGPTITNAQVPGSWLGSDLQCVVRVKAGLIGPALTSPPPAKTELEAGGTGTILGVGSPPPPESCMWARPQLSWAA